MESGECGMETAESGEWGLREECRERVGRVGGMESSEWRVESGKWWRVERGECKVESEQWRVKSGERREQNGQ